MKLINVTQMMFEESEAYVSAQSQITDRVTRDINYVVHTKLQQLLSDAPAVDAVEVVRCKDCIYFSEAKTNQKGFLICKASGMEICDDYFCSYGERKGGQAPQKEDV